MTGRARSLRALGPALLVAAAAVAAHGNGLANGFAWDDTGLIVEKPATRDLSQLPRVLLSPDEMKPYYRPLNRASYLLDYQLFGMSPRGFHLVNLALHVASALAAYALARRLFADRGPALLVALLLAVHPIHSEAVAFIAARNNLFALLFAVVSVVLFLDALPRRSRGLAALSGLAAFLAMASKEQGVIVLPFLVAWLILRPQRDEDGAGARSAWALLVPHAIAAAAYFALRTVALDGPVASTPVLPGLLGRLARNYYVIPAYLGLVVFPGRLSIFHELPRGWATLWWLPLAWAVILAAAWPFLRRPSAASTFGLVWFGLNLAPAIGLVPIPTTESTAMAERFFHASTLGVWIVAAEGVRRITARAPAGAARAGAAAIAVILVACGVRTAVRNLDWRDDLALFRSTVRAAPGSLVARFNLGVQLKDQGDLDGAEREWREALRIRADDPGSNAQLGTLAAVRGRLDEAERHFRVALAADPALVEAQFNLAKVCERTGRAAEAVEHYRAVLALSAGSETSLAAQARSRLVALASGR